MKSFFRSKIHNANAVKQFYESCDLAFKAGDHRKVSFCACERSFPGLRCLTFCFSSFQAIYLIERALQHATHSTAFLLIKAECLTMLGRYQEAQEIAKFVSVRP